MSKLSTSEWEAHCGRVVHVRMVLASASSEGRAQVAGPGRAQSYQVAGAKSPGPSRLSRVARAKSPEPSRQSLVA